MSKQIIKNLAGAVLWEGEAETLRIRGDPIMAMGLPIEGDSVRIKQQTGTHATPRTVLFHIGNVQLVFPAMRGVGLGYVCWAPGMKEASARRPLIGLVHAERLPV